MIPLYQVEQVRQASDLIAVAKDHFGSDKVTEHGAGFKTVCPFHDDTNPSLYFWPETQTWKCFGCGQGGSVFHFIMEACHLNFPDAVRELADRAGIELT